MFCFVCSANCDSPNLLVRHLKLIHGFCSARNLCIRCGQPGCIFEFSSFSGFRKHLNRVHNTMSNSYINPSSQLSFECPPCELPACSPCDLPTCSNESSKDVPVTNKSTLEFCGSAVAQLQSAGVAQSVIDTFVNTMEEAVHEIQAQVMDTAFECLTSQNPETDSKLRQSFEGIENPFSSLNSVSKRSKYFKQKWDIVDPVEKILGSRFENRKNKISGAYNQVVVTDTFSYIPILETLQSIFKDQKALSLLKSECVSKDGVYSDINDGLYIKRHPLFSTDKYAIQIQLFYDDFETANPLGSKKGIYKLGGMYFTLRNFPPKYNSSLENIHLCALFHAQDIKTYGFNSILEPLVKDIKLLETQGIDIPNLADPVRGTIVQVVGDNLGLNSMLGFVESFSARHCCRFCLLEKEKFQNVFCEDDSAVTLRTRDMHSEHCSVAQSNPMLSNVCGVKKQCLLNTLQFFSTTDNFTVDVMHDILEGIAQFEMKLVLQYLRGNHITLQEIGYRVQHFDYGHIESKNRPPVLKIEDDGNVLGVNAIQCWCLLRNLPLMFGDIVAEQNQHWSLLLLLLQIVNIVFSPILTEGLTVLLKHLINEHHRLFKHLFPQKSLLPKHHLLIHYPRSIRNIGPVLHVWCMRYEAKHNYFKRQLKSFKNITKMLAKKHQLFMACSRETLQWHRLAKGPGKMLQLCDIPEGPDIAGKLNLNDLEEPVLSVKWVKHQGTEYRPGFLVCVDVDIDLPVSSKSKRYW